MENDQRERIVEQVRRWGGPTTDAILDPSMQIFTTPEIEGFVAYHNESGSAVVFGDPICAEKDKFALARAFHKFAADQGKVIIYISASKPFAEWAIKNVCGGLIEFGQELMVDPFCDPTKESGEHASLLRRKVKHALHEGVLVEEYHNHDAELEKAIENIGKIWLKRRRGPQLHISNIYLFSDRFGKRWFYAKSGNAVVGTISLNQLQAHNGWHLNHLMILPEAPHGTTELLVTAVLEALKKEECRFASFGMVQASELGDIQGLGKFSAWLSRLVFKCARKIARLEGLNMFWGKFNPQSRPSYLLMSRNRVGLRELKGLVGALSKTTTGVNHG